MPSHALTRGHVDQTKPGKRCSVLHLENLKQSGDEVRKDSQHKLDWDTIFGLRGTCVPMSGPVETSTVALLTIGTFVTLFIYKI